MKYGELRSQDEIAGHQGLGHITSQMRSSARYVLPSYPRLRNAGAVSIPGPANPTSSTLDSDYEQQQQQGKAEEQA